MPFPFDIYPWANYQELNLAYFIARFQEIFRQWADLYDTMTTWQAQTNADLEAWKTAVVNDIIAREATLRQELAAWKASTEQDISSWETATLAALTAWQTAAEAQFETIRTQAAASATAAAGSAADAAIAKTAAETAQAAAEAAAASVAESAAQISANAAHISDLESSRISMIATDGSSLSNADLDTYTSPGQYRITSANASTITNGPVTNLSYRLIVLTTASSALPVQIAIISSSGTDTKIMIRSRTSSGWQAWTRIISDYDVVSWTTISGSSFAPADMPRNSYYYTSTASKLSNLPSDWPSGAALWICRSSANQAGNLSFIILKAFSTTSGAVQAVYLGSLSESGPAFSGWTRIANSTDISTLTGRLNVAEDNINVILAAMPHNALIGGGAVNSSNYLSIFPSAQYADAAPNSIYRISSNNLPITDAPPGNTRLISPDGNTGRMAGTLITLTAAASTPGTTNGVVQIFVAERSEYSSPICWRLGNWQSGRVVYSLWAKFEQNGFFHSSNQIIYGGSMIISDLDDMASNSIYQLDLNLDGSDDAHTLGHHPAPGVSCVAMCYNYSYSSAHGKVQVVYTIDGRMYWRYGYYQSSDDYRWTAWNFLPKLPSSLPSTDGTYSLKCTVSSGSATLSWVADA